MDDYMLIKLYFSVRAFLSQYCFVKNAIILNYFDIESVEKLLQADKERLFKICKYLKIDGRTLLSKIIDVIFQKSKVDCYVTYFYKSIYLTYERSDLNYFQEIVDQIEAGSFIVPVFEDSEIAEFIERLQKQKEENKTSKDEVFKKNQDCFTFNSELVPFGQEITAKFDFSDEEIINDEEKSLEEIVDKELNYFPDFGDEDFYIYNGISFFEKRLTFSLLPGYKYKIEIGGLLEIIPPDLKSEYFKENIITYHITEMIDKLQFEFSLPDIDFLFLPVFLFKEEVDQGCSESELRLKELFLKRFGSVERKYITSVGCSMFTLLDKIQDFLFSQSSGEFLSEDFANLDYLVKDLEKNGVFPGTCKSVSTIMYGLLRSFGIKARRVSGSVLMKNSVYSVPLGHVWVEFFYPVLKVWCPLDMNRSIIGNYVDPREEEYYLYKQMIRIPKSSKFVSIKMDRVKI